MIVIPCVAIAVVMTAAPQPLTIASPGLKAVNIDEEEAEFFSDHLAQALTLQGAHVTTPAQITAVLGLQRQKELMGCSESGTSCLTEIANALGVDAMVIGSVALLDGTYSWNISTVSAESGQPIRAISGKASSKSGLLEELSRGAAVLARETAAKLGRGLDVTLQREPSAGRRFFWAPLAGGAIAGAAGAFFLVQAKADYDAITGGSGVSTLTHEEAIDRADHGRTFQTVGIALAAVGAAAIGTGAMMYLTGDPGTPVAMVLPTGHGAAFALSGSF
ncbi:MAG: hypothetical protein IRZ16_14680 [Myxococcaceae bacterium]|nr:hypothetical protein [Myxococcaceae bacterium]